MRTVVSSSEAALLLAMDARTFPRWARGRGITPLGRVRIGRSWVTRWALADIVVNAPGPDD